MTDDDTPPQNPTNQPERQEIITWLANAQRDMGQLIARDRTHPLLASTLTMQQLKVVLTLSFHGSTAGQDLARHLGIGLGTLTGIVDRVVAQGLAHRHEDPTDRRIRRIELTPAGHHLANEFLDAGDNAWRAVLTHLDLDTLRDLQRVTRKIQATLQALNCYDA